MIRGDAKIELFNAKTGKLENVTEEHNLVTNALAYIINIEAARGAALSDNVLPIATKALGGIMLFDAELEESADNIHFPPKDAHLVGFASTNTGTNELQGSFNSVESGATDTGYVSVWDFGTSQANGTIKSVARTNWWAAINPLRYYMSGRGITKSGNPTSDAYFHPIRYDGEYLYMLKCYSNHTMKEYRVRKPKLRQKVADSPSRFENYEYVAEWDTLACEFEYLQSRYDESDMRTVQYWADSPTLYFDGRDGYYYCAYAGYDKSRAAGVTLNLFTIHYGDGSYEKSDFTQINLQSAAYIGTSSYSEWDKTSQSWIYRYANYINDWTRYRISNGYLYLLQSGRKKILQVNLKNPADQQLVKIIDDSSSDYLDSLHGIRLNGGGTFFTVYHYTTGSYEYRDGLLYEDGTYLLENFAGTNNQDDWYNDRRVNGDELEVFGYHSDVSVYQGFFAPYIGTIANLSNTIEKNASQTMKITYTLTDVDETTSSEEVGS